MLWFRNSLVCITLLLASGCGFRPLYAPQESNAPPLTSVQINPIANRLGQQLRQALEQRLYRGQTITAYQPYDLDVEYEEDIGYAAIDADASARYATITLEVVYTLTETQTGRVLLRDSVVANQGYSIVFSEYATLKAKEDARQKAIQNVADTIGYQIALAVQPAL